jgi:hypothetical protein
MISTALSGFHAAAACAPFAATSAARAASATEFGNFLVGFTDASMRGTGDAEQLNIRRTPT